MQMPSVQSILRKILDKCILPNCSSVLDFIVRVKSDAESSLVFLAFGLTLLNRD